MQVGGGLKERRAYSKFWLRGKGHIREGDLIEWARKSIPWSTVITSILNEYYFDTITSSFIRSYYFN